jgi:hypothetical protein
MAVSEGQKTAQNWPAFFPPGLELRGLVDDRAEAAGLVVRPPQQHEADHDLHDRGPRLELADRLDAVDDVVELDRPEREEARELGRVMPRTGSFSPPSGCPMITPISVWIIIPPNHVWMPYQPQATSARRSAGSRAPMVPKEERASTAYGNAVLGAPRGR